MKLIDKVEEFNIDLENSMFLKEEMNSKNIIGKVYITTLKNIDLKFFVFYNEILNQYFYILYFKFYNSKTNKNK